MKKNSWKTLLSALLLLAMLVSMLPFAAFAEDGQTAAAQTEESAKTEDVPKVEEKTGDTPKADGKTDATKTDEKSGDTVKDESKDVPKDDAAKDENKDTPIGVLRAALGGLLCIADGRVFIFILGRVILRCVF